MSDARIAPSELVAIGLCRKLKKLPSAPKITRLFRKRFSGAVGVEIVPETLEGWGTELYDMQAVRLNNRHYVVTYYPYSFSKSRLQQTVPHPLSIDETFEHQGYFTVSLVQYDRQQSMDISTDEIVDISRDLWALASCLDKQMSVQAFLWRRVSLLVDVKTTRKLCQNLYPISSFWAEKEASFPYEMCLCPFVQEVKEGCFEASLIGSQDYIGQQILLKMTGVAPEIILDRLYAYLAWIVQIQNSEEDIPKEYSDILLGDVLIQQDDTAICFSNITEQSYIGEPSSSL